MEWKTEADWKATIDENLRMGFVELFILHMLCDRDMYGYELKKAIVERTGGVFQFGETSLYVPLLRMASRGLISSNKVTAVGKRFRTYYHIEEFGRKYLEYGKEQCSAIFTGITTLFNWEMDHSDVQTVSDR